MAFPNTAILESLHNLAINEVSEDLKNLPMAKDVDPNRTGFDLWTWSWMNKMSNVGPTHYQNTSRMRRRNTSRAQKANGDLNPSGQIEFATRESTSFPFEATHH